MKTISDIKAELESIDQESKTLSQEACNRAMEFFKDIPEIESIESDLENMQNGEYSFDDFGMLIYSVKVPSHISDLPFINDYLTRDYYHLSGHKKHLRLAQTVGTFISINWNHERNSWFVYDSDTHRPIIPKQESWMDKTYVAALIAQHQNKCGCFYDVVEINSRYGWYEKHFDTWEYLKEHLDHQEDVKALEALIESYNQGNDNE